MGRHFMFVGVRHDKSMSSSEVDLVVRKLLEGNGFVDVSISSKGLNAERLALLDRLSVSLASVGRDVFGE